MDRALSSQSLPELSDYKHGEDIFLKQTLNTEIFQLAEEWILSEDGDSSS